MYPAHYQLTSSLLQVTVSPDAYRAFLRKYRRGQITTKFSKYLAGPDYWESIPTYLIARCPFCAAVYTAKIDTYSLAGWHPHHELYRDVYCEDYQHVGCEHFVGVQTFVNLQGQMPTELTYYSSYLDVPFVTPTLLPSDLPTVAVMHSLPICRIEHEEFVPRYTAYMLTYYALYGPAALRERRRAENEASVAADPTFYPTLLYSNAEAAAQPDTFDLMKWVARGKLLTSTLRAKDEHGRYRLE